MDAAEARAQLAMTERRLPLTTADRRAYGLVLVVFGLSTVAVTGLRDHPWTILALPLLCLLTIPVMASRQTKPKRLMWVYLLAMLPTFAWAMVDAIWFFDRGLTDPAVRWTSAVLMGISPVAVGLFIMRKPAT
jgi:hypothetical protein